MPDEPLRYAVLIGKPEDYRPVELARALAALKKVPEHDLINQARGCWGIVEESLVETEARATASGLEKAGLSALAVPAPLLEELPPLSVVKSLPPLRPERLVILAAAGYNEVTTRKVKGSDPGDLAKKAIGLGITMMTGMPTSLGREKKDVEKTVESSDLLFYLDLVLKEPWERLRIDGQKFDYSCLGARKTYSVIINFRQLLCDLADAAPAARRSRGSRILLEQKPVRDMGYQSLADLERETRWLLTLDALKR